MKTPDPFAPTDTIVQQAPSSKAFSNAVEIDAEQALSDVRRLDDLDYYAFGITPEHAGMLRLAAGQLGVRESGGDNNGVPLERYVRWFAPQSPPVPWCAYFVSWCYDRATDANRRVPWTNPGYVGSITAWGRGANRVVSSPQTGDIFCHGTEHCGIVNRVSGNSFSTIEGNFSDRVAAATRQTSGYVFVRI